MMYRYIFLILKLYYLPIYLTLMQKIKSILFYLGALLLESKIQHDTVYQKQQVSLFLFFFIQMK